MTVMRWTGVLATLAVLTLAGCGSSSSSSGSGSSGSSSTPAATATATSASSAGGGGTVAIAADPGGALKFTQTSVKAKAGKVTINFTNQSSTAHAVAVEGNGVSKSGAVVTGGSNSLTLDLKAGTYTFFCPVDGHRQAGMEGKLVVG